MTRLLSLERDRDIILAYHEVEQNAPQWFRDGSDVWQKDDLLEWCKRHHKIYEIENKALLYVEPTGEVHFSVKRGENGLDLIPALLEIRAELFKEFDTLYGWMLKQNRGLKKICESVGFKYEGFRVFHGVVKNRVAEWHCHSMEKSSN